MMKPFVRDIPTLESSKNLWNIKIYCDIIDYIFIGLIKMLPQFHKVRES